METIKFEVTYKNQKYTFDTGSEVYIFYNGILNDLDINYNIKELLEYTYLTHTCYLSDSNNTNLGALCDYIADNWDEVKLLNKYAILEKFYKSEN